MNRWLEIGSRLIQSQRLAIVCRLVLGATFVFAGWGKIGHTTDTIQSVLAYNVLPGELVRPFSLIFPWIEFLSGWLLIIGLLLESASAMLALLNLAFLVAIGINLLQGSHIDCGCFGQVEELSWGIFARDVGYLLLSIQILVAGQGILSLDAAISACWRPIWNRRRSAN